MAVRGVARIRKVRTPAFRDRNRESLSQRVAKGKEEARATKGIIPISRTEWGISMDNRPGRLKTAIPAKA
jgi:hypothetical protein